MLRTLIVGLGRAGLGLHWEVLRRLRAGQEDAGLFSPAPALAYDIRPAAVPADRPDIRRVGSLEQARQLLHPADTVVHLCTPPTARLELVRELAALGFDKILIEKPLATDRASAEAIAELRRAERVRLTVVAHWLDSALTTRVRALVGSGRLGELHTLSFVQRKPRLRRTLATPGHPTAFDTELPHSVGVALRLAGDARVEEASWSDMRVEHLVAPRMGTARLVLRHDGGQITEIFSDLTSPVRERRLELGAAGGSIVGHYPGSQDDDYAHLSVTADGRQVRSIFRDDSLATFLRRVYRQFAAGEPGDAEFALNVRVAVLLGEAKERALRGEAATARPVLHVAEPGLRRV